MFDCFCKKKYTAQLIFVALFFTGTIAPLVARPKRNQEKLIDALLNIKIEYSDDGAADATIVPDQPLLVVRQIIKLESKAIPLLIAHLADRRLANAKYKNKRIPVGFLCLDILIQIMKGRAVHFKDCFDDGLGACIHYEYYYRLDVSKLLEMKSVQKAWARAYAARKIRYQYPIWLK